MKWTVIIAQIPEDGSASCYGVRHAEAETPEQARAEAIESYIGNNCIKPQHQQSVSALYTFPGHITPEEYGIEERSRGA